MTPKPKATWWMEVRWRLHQMRHTHPLAWLVRARITGWITAVLTIAVLSPFVGAVALWRSLGAVWDLVCELRHTQRRWMWDQCDKRGWGYDRKHDPQWLIDFHAELDAWREETRPRRLSRVEVNGEPWWVDEESGRLVERASDSETRATGIKSAICEDTGEVVPWPPEDIEL